uniref:Coiled-coil domain containing 173 n=1 Tax=Nothobranchius kuhntae TaxID=321403 RepID=A0A1A8IQ94_NOTKU
MASVSIEENAPGQVAENEAFHSLDLRKVTFMEGAQWIRIQEELSGVDKNQQQPREAAKRRAALLLQSRAMVKGFDTIADQRRKILEAKKLQEQAEEEKRKLIDIEEAKYRKQQAQEALERARTQLFNQTDRVKTFHSAHLHTNVLKEREAQIELKQKMTSACLNEELKFYEMMKNKNDKALKEMQEKTLQKKLERKAAGEDLKLQMKENELARKQKMLETIKDAEELKSVQEQYQQEQRMKLEQRENQKRNFKQAQLESLNTHAFIRAQQRANAEAEEKERQLYLAQQEQITKLRREREKEKIREAQLHSERVLGKLTVRQQDQTAREEEKMAKVVAERDAKQAQQEEEKERKKSEMLKSIVAHRELMKKEKLHRYEITKQQSRDAALAMTEAERMFAEQQQLKAEKIREEKRKLSEFNIQMMAEKSAKIQQLKEDEQELRAKNAQVIKEEEAAFQQYAQQVISKAAEERKNLYPLYKAARKGIKPVFHGIRPTYLACDSSGAEMPNIQSPATKTIRKRHEPADIREAKIRLGLFW